MNKDKAIKQKSISQYRIKKTNYNLTNNKEQEGLQVYSPAKWKSICEMTLSNYTYMLKRLKHKQRVSDFILTYYSIFLIIYSLTNKYFPEKFNSNLSEYCNIILSIVLVTYSLINSNARYIERIAQVTTAVNEIKTLKRDINKDNIQEKKIEYYKITDRTEFRDDTDFFRTVKQLCSVHSINWVFDKRINASDDDDRKRIKGYLSEISPIITQMKICYMYVKDFILLILPLVVLVLCFIIKE